MAKYTVKKVRTFMGREGHGFNAELLCDGVPVAFVINEANGGMVRFQWYKEPAQRHADISALNDHLSGKSFTFKETTLEMDPDMFVSLLVDEYMTLLAMKRRCAKHTCYRLAGQGEGEYMSVPVVFCAEVAAMLRKQYGDKLVYIYNERIKEMMS